MSKELNKKYYWVIILTMFLLPIISIITESVILKLQSLNWNVVYKWFVFWAVGIRLLIAGIKQVLNPEFTAKEILKIEGSESYVVLRELGFANICFGISGILSILGKEWYMISSISGGLYLGLAGIQHIFKRGKENNEKLAMISDLFVFIVIIICFVNTRV